MVCINKSAHSLPVGRGGEYCHVENNFTMFCEIEHYIPYNPENLLGRDPTKSLAQVHQDISKRKWMIARS